MIEELIYFSPLLVLLVSILILMFGEHEADEHYKCFGFSRIMLLISLLLAVIFYNKPPITGLSEGNRFTLLFEMLLYAGGFVLLYLSRKWFASMHRLAYIFCGCLFMAILFGDLLLSSTNLALTGISIVMLMLSNYVLLKETTNLKDTTFAARIYLFLMIICTMLFCGALFIFYSRFNVFDYDSLRLAIELNKDDVMIFAAAAMCITPFLFMLGMAPLHFCLTEISIKTILPVFVHLLLVPTVAVWSGFMRLNIEVLLPLEAYFRMFYIGVALLSVGVGAIGACGAQNVRKIFAYTSVYHTGIALLILRRFTPNAVNASFVYLFVYLLAMYGICTCLFGLKKKGEYLFMLADFEGAAQKRPYVSAMMVVFMFSLLGLPPFAGFLGLFSAFNFLALHHHFYQLLYLLLMMLALGYAYLQIVKTLYIEECKTGFDRADKGIYTAILLNAVLMVMLILQPHYLIEDVHVLLEQVFQ